MFFAVSRSCPDLIFGGKVRACSSGTPYGTCLARMYSNRVEVPYSAKRASLLRYEIIYVRKKFYNTDPIVEVYKLLK